MLNRRRRRGRPRQQLPIVGLQRLSLKDYPGKLCAKAIIPGCNFRCPYCDKADIVLKHRGWSSYPRGRSSDTSTG